MVVASPVIPNPRVLDLLHQATKIGFALMANAKKTKQGMEAYKVDLFMASFFFVCLECFGRWPGTQSTRRDCTASRRRALALRSTYNNSRCNHANSYSGMTSTMVGDLSVPVPGTLSLGAALTLPDDGSLEDSAYPVLL